MFPSSFLQHVRDYHPRDILERAEYMALRRQCCIDLDMAYREEPAFELPDPVKVMVLAVPATYPGIAVGRLIVLRSWSMVPLHKRIARMLCIRW